MGCRYLQPSHKRSQRPEQGAAAEWGWYYPSPALLLHTSIWVLAAQGGNARQGGGWQTDTIKTENNPGQGAGGGGRGRPQAQAAVLRSRAGARACFTLTVLASVRNQLSGPGTEVSSQGGVETLSLTEGARGCLQPAHSWSQTSSLEAPHNCAQIRKRQKTPKLDGDSPDGSWGLRSGQGLPVTMTTGPASWGF